jgi:hypothetical protein
VTGCSLGGDLSVTLGALDTRVPVVLAQGPCRWHGDRGQRPIPEENGSSFTRAPCGVIPGETRFTHYEDRYLLAPRPFAVINGRRDVGDIREDESWLLALPPSSLSSGGRRRSLFVCPYERGSRIPSEPGNRIPVPPPEGLHHALEEAFTLTQSLRRIS